MTMHSVEDASTNGNLAMYVRENINDAVSASFVDYFLLTITKFELVYPVLDEDAQEWLGFKLKHHLQNLANTAGLLEGVDFEVVTIKSKNLAGGRPTKNMRFTVDAFKTLCMLADTEKGKQVRVYYLQLEKVHARFVECQLRLRDSDQLAAIDAAQRSVEFVLKKSMDDTHATLMDMYSGEVHAVYFAFVRDESTKEWILKVGRVKYGIKGRLKGLRTILGTNVKYLAVVPAKNAVDFELFLHRSSFKTHRYDYRQTDGSISEECYKVTEEIYLEFLHLAKQNAHRFEYTKKEQRTMYREKLAFANIAVKQANADAEFVKAKAEEADAQVRIVQAEADAQVRIILAQETAHTLQQIAQKALNDPHDRSLREMFIATTSAISALCGTGAGIRSQAVYVKPVASDVDTSPVDSSNDAPANSRGVDIAAVGTNEAPASSTGDVPASSSEDVPASNEAGHPRRCRVVSRGSAYQKYDTTGKTLLGSYQGISEASEESKGSQCGIRRAARDRRAFYGYRWHELSRDLDKNIAYDIGETVYSKAVETALIARLSRDGSAVTKVYLTQEEAAKAEGFKSSQPVFMAIKNNTISAGVKWAKWNDLSEEIQDAHLEHHDLPEYSKKGTRIQRLHPSTGAVEDTVDSITAAMAKYKLGRKSLLEACADNTEHKGWCWKIIE